MTDRQRANYSSVSFALSLPDENAGGMFDEGSFCRRVGQHSRQLTDCNSTMAFPRDVVMHDSFMGMIRLLFGLFQWNLTQNAD
jgi:hypothetical protein